jgi:hypothetical protein
MPSLMDVSTEKVDQALKVAIARLQGRQAGETRYGRQARSVGCIVTSPGFPERWLKVKWAPADEIDRLMWDGELLSTCLEDVSKPRIFAHFDWEANGDGYRALVMAVARGIVSETPRLDRMPVLEPRWWDQLEHALANIQARPTDRTRFDDAEIGRRLRQQFSLNLRLPFPFWQTAHGDLHWANLTAPEFSILDWETWGRAPYGLDVARLHLFALTEPRMLAKLKEVFSAVMARPQYDVAFLFIAAAVIRLFHQHGYYPRLQADLRPEVARVLKAGRIMEFCD